MYLSTLEEYFGVIQDTSSDFKSLENTFPIMMYQLLLIYQNSEYYNTPSRIVLLLREICNSLIQRAQEFVPGELVVQMMQSKDEVEQICQRLYQVNEVFAKFKESYFRQRTKAGGLWKFPPNALFISLDNFTERCYDVYHITQTIMQFNQLEFYQVGGTKGKVLSDSIQQIYNEFVVASKSFSNLGYDIMDTNMKEFEEEFYSFREKIKELERRIATIIIQSLDDSENLIDRFKIIEFFDVMLQRPLVQEEVEKRFVKLIDEFKDDLKTVQSIFLKGRDLVSDPDSKVPVYGRLPAIVQKLTWAQSLRKRIEGPYVNFKETNFSIEEKEEFKDVEKLYQTLLGQIEYFKDGQVLGWRKEVEETAYENLKQPLLKRVPKNNTL